jgi:multiple sugar transport system permease protein
VSRSGLRNLPMALAFIFPAAVGFGVFLVWPALRGIWLSFTDYSVFQPGEFVGFANYERMFADPVFWSSMRITIYYVLVNIGLQTVLALVLAVLLNRLTQSMVVRGIVLTPYLVSNVVTAMLWLLLLDYQLGFVNQLLEWVGVERESFWGNPTLVVPTIALVNVWRHVGYTALLIFAGLQTISPQVYEAGKVDGASEWTMFWRITLPLLRPYLAMVLIVTSIGSFQVFDTVSVATQGGPANSSNVIQHYIYNVAFGRYDFGYASAMSVALLVVLSAITVVQYRLSRAGDSDVS